MRTGITKYVRCRFCTHAEIDERTGELRCDVRKQTMTDKQGKSYRQCKDYELINLLPEEIDFYGEIEYKPRIHAIGYNKRSKKHHKNQIKLF